MRRCAPVPRRPSSFSNSSYSAASATLRYAPRRSRASVSPERRRAAPRKLPRVLPRSKLPSQRRAASGERLFSSRRCPLVPLQLVRQQVSPAAELSYSAQSSRISSRPLVDFSSSERSVQDGHHRRVALEVCRTPSRPRARSRGALERLGCARALDGAARPSRGNLRLLVSASRRPARVASSGSDATLTLLLDGFFGVLLALGEAPFSPPAWLLLPPSERACALQHLHQTRRRRRPAHTPLKGEQPSARVALADALEPCSHLRVRAFPVQHCALQHSPRRSSRYIFSRSSRSYRTTTRPSALAR